MALNYGFAGIGMNTISVNGNRYKAHELDDCAYHMQCGLVCHVRRCSLNEASGTALPTRVINCGYNRAIYSDRVSKTHADYRTLMASILKRQFYISIIDRCRRERFSSVRERVLYHEKRKLRAAIVAKAARNMLINY